MSKVWIVKWEDTFDPDCSISIYDSEEKAYKDALCGIMENINNDWDITDPDVLNTATEISLHIAKKEYSEAMDCYNYFNSEQSNSFNGTYCTFWSVWCEDIKTIDLVPDQLMLPIDEDDDVITISAPVAKKCGATCRSCNTPNDYAYPDKDDMTYMCCQCKVFKGIFT